MWGATQINYPFSVRSVWLSITFQSSNISKFLGMEMEANDFFNRLFQFGIFLWNIERIMVSGKQSVLQWFSPIQLFSAVWSIKKQRHDGRKKVHGSRSENPQTESESENLGNSSYSDSALPHKIQECIVVECSLHSCHQPKIAVG